jgi:hypothetical protein
LTVTQGAASYSSASLSEHERLGDLDISRRPSTALSTSELSEAARRLRALGYLGGR